MNMEQKTSNPSHKHLDIREVFRNKSPRTARLVPGFIYRYLHKALVVDDINEILRLYGHLEDIDFANACISHFNVTVDYVGEEHIPDEGRFIFACNHPLGGFDGVLISSMIDRHFHGRVKVLVNDILMNIENTRGIFIPVNKHGAQAVEHVKLMDRIFSSDDQVQTFPAGLVSRRNKGVIRDPEWKKSFITKAVGYKRDIIPMHITGRCTNFFYTVANLRKLLRIKANLEMFYLPRETFRHKNNHYTMTIGKPISHTVFDKSKRPAEWAALVKEHCYRLPGNPGLEFSH